MRVLALLLAATPALAAEGVAVTGPLGVVDADTFDVGPTRVRLHGVDAPEAAQACAEADGTPWPCGAWAAESARAWEGQEATCVGVDEDRHGRLVARCAVGGEDLGAALVASGAALAYRAYALDYVAAEAEAEAAGAGMWRGAFQPPWEFRASGAVPEGCAIKGNLSDAGRVFHVPGGPFYARTRIDVAQGERWFCSTAEALAAGWRAPL